MQFWNVVICLNSNHPVWIPLDVFRGKDKDKEKQTKKEPATEHFAGFKKEKTEAEVEAEMIQKEMTQIPLEPELFQTESRG